jgi:hypothetical protein
MIFQAKQGKRNAPVVGMKYVVSLGFHFFSESREGTQKRLRIQVVFPAYADDSMAFFFKLPAKPADISSNTPLIALQNIQDFHFNRWPAFLFVCRFPSANILSAEN